jgi:streptogramin lyase
LWGTSSGGQVWGADANANAAFSIAGNAGQIANVSGPMNAILGPSGADESVAFTGSLTSYSNTNMGAVVRWQDGNNWYKGYLTDTALILQKRVGGAYTQLASAPHLSFPGVDYGVRLQVIGNTISARVWNAGSPEPSSWALVVVDNSINSGYGGLRIQMTGGMTARITSFVLTSPSGPPPSTPTSTPTPSGAIQRFPLTGGAAQPWGTAFDSAGNLWIAEPGCDFAPTCSAGAGPGQLVKVPAGSTTPVFYALPNIPGNQPIFVALDNLGKVWFTTPNNSMIGQFDPVTSTFVGQWPVTAGSGPWDLVYSQGSIWYTEHFTNKIGRFNPVTHAVTDFTTPSQNSNPYGIAARGTKIWFTENTSSVQRIGVLDTANGNAISEYLIRAQVSGNLTPHMLELDAQGNVWWTEGWVRAIGRLNPSQATPGVCGASSGNCNGVVEYALPPAPSSCPNTHVSGIGVVQSSGLVWFDDSLSAQIGRFAPSSGNYVMYSLPGCANHPHDGLTLDAAQNPWWTEQFVNVVGHLLP